MEILNEFDEKDIYNADETGLFYKSLPDRSCTKRGIAVKGHKKKQAANIDSFLLQIYWLI